MGTVALGMFGGSLTACKNIGSGDDVRNNALDGHSEELSHDEEAKCGGMKTEDGSEHQIEAKCGEEMDSTQMKTEEMLCGEGKCGEGMCGGVE